MAFETTMGTIASIPRSSSLPCSLAATAWAFKQVSLQCAHQECFMGYQDLSPTGNVCNCPAPREHLPIVLLAATGGVDLREASGVWSS